MKPRTTAEEPIENCAFGELTVRGTRYATDLVILPDGTVRDGWRRREGHRLAFDDLAALLAAQPRKLVVGSGYYGRMAPEDGLAGRLERMGISMTVAPTCSAAERYNGMWGREEGVAACFHLTC